MSLSVKQLASLIALGGELPEIQCQASDSKDMLPNWDNPSTPSLMEQFKKTDSETDKKDGKAGPKIAPPSAIMDANLTGRGNSSPPPPASGGFSI